MYILGNSGYAYSVYDQFLSSTNKFSGFITLQDGKPYVITNSGINEYTKTATDTFVLGIDVLDIRETYINYFSKLFEDTDTHFPNLYGKNALIASTVSLGCGNIFFPFSTTSGISTIGNFNIISAHTSIGYNCTIGNNNIINPHGCIMKNSRIGNNNIIDANATVTSGISIKDNNLVSAGESLFDDLESKELFQSGIIQRI